MNQESLDTQIQAASSKVTLALSFWKTFRDEVARICEEKKNFDGRPYIRFEEKSVRIEDVGTETQELVLRCGCFEFAAVLEPLSLAIVYATHLLGMESIFDNRRALVGRGLISLSQAGETYFVQATPAIQELLLSKETCGYDRFWEIGVELARWSCGSIVLRRLGRLREAASATTA